jgi:transposase/IS5 family transposase
MRGDDRQQQELYSYGSLEDRVSRDHPLRRIRVLADAALARLSARFDGIYGDTGRPSIAPEKLLRALLLQVLYSVRSERALMDQIDLHLGFRWFVGLTLNELVWEASTFSKNRERLLGGEIAQEFLHAVLDQARRKHWLSDERFVVDGTLIEAWASKKSYQPKDDPPAPGQGSGRRGELQKRDLYESKTDPEARLFKKSGGAISVLSYLGHVLSDMRHGLIAAACVTEATTRGERDAAVEMIQQLPVRRRRIQVAADKAYDEIEYVKRLRQCAATPQVTQYTGQRSSAIDRRTTRHRAYTENQFQRRHVERIFAWLKRIGGQRKARFRGRQRVGWMFQFAAAAYNLVRMINLENSAQPS